MSVFAIVAPGQGSQTPGMLRTWLEDPALADLVASFGEAAGLDLVELGTTADAATITDTSNAQPLIVTAALVSATALFGGLPVKPPRVVAGHSVGELSALAVAGVLGGAEAVALAARRGAGMAKAAAAVPSGMSAVVGGRREDVLAAIGDAGCVAANVNSAGQVVAAGTPEQLAHLADNPPARARVIPLQVAGAFHTVHMAPAQATFADDVARLTPSDPSVTLLSNRDGSEVTDGADAVARLVTQLTSPVRWDLCMATMTNLGVTAIIELAPGGVLTGLAKREMKGVPAVAISSPADLDDARELMEQTA
ncbi:MAG TPA: ACP S-malonyltransferase [Actinomycetaceae bacterium]|nr:ACP S-malonyltransferase [Actinomycetaceae bacterium]